MDHDLTKLKSNNTIKDKQIIDANIISNTLKKF